MIDTEMQPGDMVRFTQADGRCLVVLAGTDGLTVKADNPGTVLDAEPLTEYTKILTARERRKR